MCFSKFNFLSTYVPNNLTDDSMVNSRPFIFNTDLLRHFLELINIYSNLSGLTIILFVLNQYTAVSHSFRKSSKIYVKSSRPTYIKFSSENFASSASLMKKKKSFMKSFKRNGPRIDPWVIPDKTI